MRKFTSIIIISIIFFASTSVYAEKTLRFRHLTTEDGLASNTIRKLYQDEYGYVWVGTLQGLNRFDSYKFKKYTVSPSSNSIRSLFHHKTSNTLWVGTTQGLYIYDYAKDSFSPSTITEIQNFSIESIKQDSMGNLWLAVSGMGVTRYNPANGEIKHFRHNTSDSHSISSTHITDILIDNDSKVWILTLNEGINLYDPVTQDFQRISVQSYDGVAESGFFCGTVTSDGSVWLGGWNNGLFRIERSGSRITNFRIKTDNGVPIKRIHSIAKLNDGTMLIGSDEGLTSFDPRTGRTNTTIFDPEDSRGLNDRFVYPVMQDSEGGIWIGTYFGGVNYASPNSTIFELFSFGTGSDKLGGRIVSRLSEDRHGQIWIGTDDAGLYKFNPATGRFARTIISPTDEPLNIHALYADIDNIWVGTYQSGLFRYNMNTGQSVKIENVNSVYALHKDSQGVMWIGAVNALYTLRQTEKTPHREFTSDIKGILDIAEDKYRNTIWIASTSKGLTKFNYEDGTYTDIYDSSFTAKSVRSMVIDNNNIWIGTAGYGIVRYDLETQSFLEKPILSCVLADKAVYGIIPKENKLWITTSDGFYLYDISKGSHRLFNGEDGLQSNQFSPATTLFSSDRRIYIGGAKGFNRFDPDELPSESREYPLAFTSFLIFNQEAAIGDGKPLQSHINISRNILLDHTQNVFSIEFAQLNYGGSSKSRYKYRLIGFNTDYTESTQGVHSVTYTNLPHGKYTFEVLTTNGIGQWDLTPESISITILPPWWASVPMNVAYFILSLSLITVIFRFFQSRSDKKNREKIARINAENEQKIISAKIDFFTHIAHEIRTPATLIAAPVEDILKTNNLPGELGENLEIIRRNSNRLVSLINQILDFRRMEAPSFEIINSPTDMRTLIQGVVSQFSAEARTRNTKLILNIDSKHNFIANIDSEAMTKIVSNLLSNALKFTTDRITITLVGSTENSLLLTVADNGPGIEAENIHKIFTSFYTSDHYTSRPSKGFGIGLSLVSILASKMNIKINVLSQNGDGAKFELLIPRAEVSHDIQVSTNIEHETETEHEDLAENTPKAERILIVEDNSDFAYYLHRSIGKRYEALVATNGDEALGILKKEHIDLIISDVAMPVMNGVELCSRIKEDLNLSHIPIILLTAQTDTDSKIRGLDGGADVYLDKPVSMEFLYAQMISLLEKRRVLRESFSQLPTAPITNITQNKTDLNFVNKLTAIIDSNISNADFLVDDLARAVSMSRSALYTKLKGVSSLSPNDFIRLTRLRKAAQYLTEGNYRIGEISYLVGFNNPSYFSRCFFEQYGVLPKDYIVQQSTNIDTDPNSK